MSLSRRVLRLRRAVIVDTQRIRTKTLQSLEELFDLAVRIARGEVRTQTVDGKRVRVGMKQRQMWARIAAYIAQIMNSIAEGFDAREVDAQLDELERMVDEAKAKREARKDQAGDGRGRGPEG
jgi:hypothetical protein